MSKVKVWDTKTYFSVNHFFSGIWNNNSALRKDWHRQEEAPMRVVGVFQMRTGDIPDRWRKRMDSAIRRGYMLENRTILPELVSLFASTADTPVPIGYVGKQDGGVYLLEDDVGAAWDSVVSWYMMTGEAREENVRRHNSSAYVWCGGHHVDVALSHGMDALGLVKFGASFYVGNDGSEAPQLKHAAKGFRKAVDPYLEHWAEPRNALADALQDDDYIVRIPFDSHLNR